jgi:hypothetical protein
VSELKKDKAHLEEVLKNFLLERELEKIREEGTESELEGSPKEGEE